MRREIDAYLEEDPLIRDPSGPVAYSEGDVPRPGFTPGGYSELIDSVEQPSVTEAAKSEPLPEPMSTGEMVQPLDSVSMGRPMTEEASAANQTAAESITAPGSKPAPGPQGDSKQQAEYLEALRSISSYQPPDGLTDSAIAAAQQRDRGQQAFDRISHLMSEGVARHDLAKPSAMGSEADDLLKRRGLGAQDASARNALKLGIANALRPRQTNPEDPSKAAYRLRGMKKMDEDEAWRREERTRRDAENRQTIYTLMEGFPKLREKLKNVDLSNLKADALDKLVSDIQSDKAFGRDIFKMEKGQGFQKEMDTIRADREIEKEDREQALPGMQRDRGIKLAPDEVKNLRTRIGDTKSIKGAIDKLERLVEKHGVEAWPTNARAEMEGMLKHLQLLAKGEALYKLGVLSGPDMDILTAITGDPTKWSAIFKGDSSGVLTKLRTMRENLDGNLASALEAHGYKQAAAQPVAGGEHFINVRRKKDGVTRKMTAADAKRFLATPDYEAVR